MHNLGPVVQSALWPPPEVGSTVSLVGRDAQLATLGMAVQSARDHAVVRIVEGESGAGKSSLVQTFLHELAENNPTVVVLAGRCYERGPVPFGGLHTLVDALGRFLRAQPSDIRDSLIPESAGALVRTFPVLGGRDRIAVDPVAIDASLPVDLSEQRRHAFGAFRDLLVRVSSRWPLVLFVDDVQWSDADTAALLSEVLRPPDAPPMLLVLACRRDDLSSSPLLSRVLELARDELDPLDIGFVHVDNLPADHAHSLVRALVAGGRAVTERAAEHIVTEAKGNPYLIEQLARRAETIGPDATLDTLLRARVAVLSEPARRLIDTVAVAGVPISRALAWRAAGAATDGQASDSSDACIVDGLVNAQLLRLGGPELGSGCELEMWHHREREWVVADQTPASLRVLHLRLAAALEDQAQPDADALSMHLLAAGEGARAAPWCVRAGNAAVAAGAFDRAIRHYGNALRHGAPGLETRYLLARVLAASGRGLECARVQLAAAPLAAPDAALQLRAEASLRLLRQGRVEEGTGALTAAFAHSGCAWPSSPWRALVSLVFRRAFLRVRGRAFRPRPTRDIDPRLLARIDTLWSAAVGLAPYDPLRSADFHARGFLLALRAGAPSRLARAVSMELLRSAAGGSHNQARTQRLSAELESLVADLPDEGIAARALLDRGIAAFLAGQFVQARQLIEGAQQAFRSRCAESAWERDTVHPVYLRVLTCLGDIRTLLPLTRSILRESLATGQTSVELQMHAHHFAPICDDTPEGRVDELDTLLTAMPCSSAHAQHVVHLLAASELDLYEGRAAEAWDRLARTWPVIAKTTLLQVQVSRVDGAFLRGRCSLALAESLPPADPRRTELLAIADTEIRGLLRERVAWAAALASLLEASRARVTGRADASLSLVRAAERLDAVDMRLHAMAARLRAAEWEQRADWVPRIWMEEQGVQDPDRLARLFVPGA